MSEGSGEKWVLVAFEKYRAYEPVIAKFIQQKRPHMEVTSHGGGTLATEVRLFDPHLVMRGQPRPKDLGARLYWMRLSTDPRALSERCIDGERHRQRNPLLAEPTAAPDETERLASAGHGPEGVLERLGKTSLTKCSRF